MRLQPIVHEGATPDDQLQPHPAVRDVCAIGVPHDRVGERICACVVRTS